MKAKILIMLVLLTALICAFVYQGHSQSNDLDFYECICGNAVGGVYNDTTLIADETYLITNRTKTEGKINCYNESVFRDLYKSHSSLFKGYKSPSKRDRKKGNYLWVIYLHKRDASYIVKWAKTNL